MTLIGFNRCRDGMGLVWADGEMYRPVHGDLFVPSDEDDVKLVVSSGGLVGCAAGYLYLCERFREMIKRFGDCTFDDAAARLPLMLRAEAYEKSGTYLLAGWSAGAARCAVFQQTRNFEPFETDSWTSPAVNYATPQNAAAVVDIAMSQLSIIRRELCRDATGRLLTVARIGSLRTVKTSVPLLIGDKIETRNFWRTRAGSVSRVG